MLIKVLYGGRAAESIYAHGRMDIGQAGPHEHKSSRNGVRGAICEWGTAIAGVREHGAIDFYQLLRSPVRRPYGGSIYAHGRMDIGQI